MTLEDGFILTHYTDITEAKQHKVRQLQAEATRTVLRDMISCLRRAFQRSPIDTQARGLDQL